MNNLKTYKHTKINWWLILPFAGIFVWAIIAYINQWGNVPFRPTTLIIFCLMMLPFLLMTARSKIIIDNEYAVFRSDLWTFAKIPINQIRNIYTKKTSWYKMTKMNLHGKNAFSSDFTKEAVVIHLRGKETYQITIKNAQEIKDEIEKRMNK